MGIEVQKARRSSYSESDKRKLRLPSVDVVLGVLSDSGSTPDASIFLVKRLYRGTRIRPRTRLRVEYPVWLAVSRIEQHCLTLKTHHVGRTRNHQGCETPCRFLTGVLLIAYSFYQGIAQSG